MVHQRNNNTTDISRDEESKIISIQHSERAKPPTSIDPDQLTQAGFATGTLVHNFTLLSVYKYNINNDIEATFYQNEWFTVDYIFYRQVLSH